MRTCARLDTFPLDKTSFLSKFVAARLTESRANLFDFINRTTARLSRVPLPAHANPLRIRPAVAFAPDHSQFALLKTKANKLVGGGSIEEERRGAWPCTDIKHNDRPAFEITRCAAF